MPDDDLDRRLRDSGTRLASRPLPPALRARLLAVPATTAAAPERTVRRGLEIGLALAVAGGLAAVLAVGFARRHASPPPSATPSHWHQALRVRVTGGPDGALAAGGGTAWITTRGHTRLFRVDAATRLATLLAVPTTDLQGGGLPSATSTVLATGGNIWVATQNKLVEVDRGSGRIEGTVPVSGVGSAHALVTDGTSLWAASGDTGAVYRIDLASRGITAIIPVVPVVADPDRPNPSGLALAGGLVWAAGENGTAVVGIDPRSGRVVRDLLLPDPASDLATAGGSLWVASQQDGVVLRIDPADGMVQATIRVTQPAVLAAAGGALWVASGTSMVRVDIGSNRVTDSVDVGAAVFAVAADGDTVWVASGPEPYVSRLVPTGGH